MAHCDEYWQLISAGLDGALSPAEEEALSAHLAQCPECKALYEELSALHAALSDLPPAEVPADLHGRIMKAVAAEQVLPFVPLEKKKSPVHWQRWLASAAVLAVIFAGAWGLKPWDSAVKTADLSPALQSQAPVAAVSVAPELASEPGAALPDQAGPTAPAEPVPQSGTGGVSSRTGKIASDFDPVAETKEVPAAHTASPRVARIGNEEEPFSDTSPESIEGESADHTPALFSAPPPQPSEALAESGSEDQDPAVSPALFSILPPQEAPAPKNGGALYAAATSLPIPEESANDQAPPQPLTVEEALDLVADYCFGSSGYEMVREDLEGDVPSAHFTLLDSAQPFTGGTILSTGESEEFFLFECHWDDEPENPYRYSVHRTEGQVAWLGETPAEGELCP